MSVTAQMTFIYTLNVNCIVTDEHAPSAFRPTPFTARPRAPVDYEAAGTARSTGPHARQRTLRPPPELDCGMETACETPFLVPHRH
jgi:hypothetical protein